MLLSLSVRAFSYDNTGCPRGPDMTNDYDFLVVAGTSPKTLSISSGEYLNKIIFQYQTKNNKIK